MAFPTTGVLDDFNRADANNLGANWTEPLFASSLSSDWVILTNRAKANAASGTPSNAYYNVATYGPDCEIYVTVIGSIQNNRNMELLLRLTGSGGTPDGYALRVRPQAVGDVFQVYRLDNGIYTQLGADIAQEVAGGDSFGLEMVGSTLTVYYKATAGSWVSLGTRSDSTYTGAGHLGLNYNHTTPVFEDFGGGTISGGSDTALVVQDATQAQSADNVALTQQYVVTVADAVQAQAVDNVALVQAHVLAVNDTTQAQIADSVALTQQYVLTVQETVQAQIADTISLTQQHLLAVADAAQAQVADNVSLTQQFVLTVQDAAQAQVAENVSVATGDSLVVQDATQAQLADNVDLVQQFVLAVQSAAQAQVADSPALVQDYLLAVQDAAQAQTADNVTLMLPGVSTLTEAQYRGMFRGMYRGSR